MLSKYVFDNGTVSKHSTSKFVGHRTCIAYQQHMSNFDNFVQAVWLRFSDHHIGLSQTAQQILMHLTLCEIIVEKASRF